MLSWKFFEIYYINFEKGINNENNRDDHDHDYDPFSILIYV